MVQAVVISLTSSAPCEGFDIEAVVRAFMAALSLQSHQVSGSFACGSVIVTLAARAETTAEVSRLVQMVSTTFSSSAQATSLLGITVTEVSAPQTATAIFAAPASSGGGLGGGPIVGIIIGSLAGVGLLAAVAFMVSKKQGGGSGVEKGIAV